MSLVVPRSMVLLRRTMSWSLRIVKMSVGSGLKRLRCSMSTRGSRRKLQGRRRVSATKLVIPNGHEESCSVLVSDICFSCLLTLATSHFHNLVALKPKLDQVLHRWLVTAFVCLATIVPITHRT